MRKLKREKKKNEEKIGVGEKTGEGKERNQEE